MKEVTHHTLRQEGAVETIYARVKEQLLQIKCKIKRIKKYAEFILDKTLTLACMHKPTYLEL